MPLAQSHCLKFPRRREREVLASVTDMLSKLGIWHERRNTGGAADEYGRYVRFGLPGTADIQATVRVPLESYLESLDCSLTPVIVVWIETKSSTGTQQKNQKVFQLLVESVGHKYVKVRSAAELYEWMKETFPWY